MKFVKTAIFLMPFILGASTSYGQFSVANSSSSAKNDNDKSKNTNNVVGALNLGLSASYFAQCPPINYAACVQGGIYLLLGMLNKKQASENGNVAGQAGGTLAATDVGSLGGYDPASDAALNRDPEISAGNRFGNAATNGASLGGATYDAATNTVKLPNGRTISASDVSSPAAMAAAGFSSDVIAGVTAKQKEFEAKANAKLDKYGLNKMVVNGDEGGGGGGGGSQAMANNGDGLYGANAGSKHGSGLGVNRDPAQVAGMQKDFNGEPIGVAGDNLFGMMTRRYKVKESQRSFLDESALLQK